MQYRADFHTHTTMSPDGALTAAHYRKAFERRLLDVVAVTDHNTTDMAKQLQTELGDRIIVGEEITTLDGEIIGLYLQETIPPLLSAQETVRHIREQGGLVYIPHPFETVRKGLTNEVLASIADEVDIIEAYNGRAVFQNRTKDALEWAQVHAVPVAASSDAHGPVGWNKTYTVLGEMPTRSTLMRLLKDASHTCKSPGVWGLAYPKLNRLRKWKWGI